MPAMGLTVPARRARTAFVRGYARATARARVLPDYLIIGAQKAGTTSLLDQLGEHPCVGRPFKKEIHYFTLNAARSPDWYRAHFPPSAEAERIRARTGTAMRTGEATPYYLFHPGVPAAARALLPDARLIVLLRDPVLRAHSHHNHEVALGYEGLSLEAAIDAEAARLAGEAERLAADPSAESFTHRHSSYVARGRYAVQLERWLEHYPREQLHVVISEELFADPAGRTVEVQEFLGLPPVPPEDVVPRNARRYDCLDAGVRARLAARFADDNQRLVRLLGRDLPWA